MKDPIVTVVVPVFQRLPFLREALPSVLRQTYGDFEVIVTDDGASDEIAGFIASLGDCRVRYRGNPHRLGIAMNSFAAFSEARGRYIANLHDDDIWEPAFLASLIPPLEADLSISVAFCDHFIIDGQGRVLPEHSDRNTRFFRRDRLRPGRHQPFLAPVAVDVVIPMVMAAVFRQSILEGAAYPPRIGGSFDHWLAYLAVKDGQACYYLPERLTRYRVHAQSGTSARGVRNLRDALFVRKRILLDPQLAPQRKRLRNDLGVLYGKLALYYLAARSPRRGRLFLQRAFSLLRRPKNILALAVKALLILCGRRRR